MSIRTAKVPVFVTICIILTTWTSSVHAGGYEWGGLGSRAQSMGGAFIGLADDWSAIYWNPAGLTQLDGMGAGFDFASPHPVIKDGSSLSNLLPGNMETRYQIDTFAQYTGIEPTRFNKETVEYDFYFPSGAGGYWKCMGLNMAVGFYTPAGYFADFKDTMGYGAGTINAKLYQALGIRAINYSLAKQINPALSIGAGVNILHGNIDYEAKKEVVGSGILDYKWGFESDCDGTGYEGVFGFLTSLNDKLSLGGVYRTGGTIDLKGDATSYLTLTGLSERSDFTQKFRYPSTYGLGLAYKARPDLTVTGDWQRTNWSEFRIDVDYKTPVLALTDKDYSADWKDSDRYRFGLEYKPTDKWALRTGYFFDKTPVRDKSVSMSNIADVDRHNIVFGVGRELRKNIQLDLVYHYAWGDRTVNGVHYEQRINSVGVSLACKF